jgi:hypothetical protein
MSVLEPISEINFLMMGSEGGSAFPANITVCGSILMKEHKKNKFMKG